MLRLKLVKGFENGTGRGNRSEPKPTYLSVMQTSVAPQSAAAMLGAPTPAPSSITLFPLTSPGLFMMRSANASPDGQGRAQKGSMSLRPRLQYQKVTAHLNSTVVRHV